MKSKKSLVAACHERLFLNFFWFSSEACEPFLHTPENGFAARVCGDFQPFFCVFCER